MWWNRKNTSKEQLVIQIIEESIIQTGMTRDILATRLIREAGLEEEAAQDLAKDSLEEFIRISYDKKLKLIEDEFPECFTLPFSELNNKLIKHLIHKLSANKIEAEQFVESLSEMKVIESNAWFIKGMDSKVLGNFNEALDNFDISLDFDHDNRDALMERGQLLQNLSYHKDAVKDFSRILENDENNFNIYYLRGCSYLNLCEFEKSYSDITMAIEKSALANDYLKQWAKDSGYDSVGAMYASTLPLLETLKTSPSEVTARMIEKNGKERAR